MFSDDKYRFGPFHLDVEQRLLFCDSKEIPFPILKFDLLRVLLERRNTVVSYKVLLSEAWPEIHKPEDDPRPHAHKVQVHINEIRNVLEDYGECIQPVRGRGYRFSNDILKRIERKKSSGLVAIQRPAPSRGQSFVIATESNQRPEIPPPEREVQPARVSFLPSTAVQPAARTEEELTAVEKMPGPLLRRCKAGYASTIRFFGAADEYIMPEKVVIHYSHDPYKIPHILRSRARERTRKKTLEAKQKNKVFFDGPNIRLIHWTYFPPESGSEAAREQNLLRLYLGPIGWYEFEGTNGLIAEEELDPERVETYRHWVDLPTMLNDFRLEHSTLSNLLCNTITIFTPDGKVGYGIRRDRQSTVPLKLSCAVAENINRYLDDVDRHEPWHLLNSSAAAIKLSDRPDNNYVPVGLPHPLAAVRRGLNEETSHHMTDHVLEGGIKVTGLDFGLDILHPFLLWIVLVNLTADEFTRECAIDAGKDSYEAEVRFVSADCGALETRNLLARKDWVPGGKASLVRALQLIDTIKSDRHVSVPRVFEILAAAR